MICHNIYKFYNDNPVINLDKNMTFYTVIYIKNNPIINSTIHYDLRVKYYYCIINSYGTNIIIYQLHAVSLSGVGKGNLVFRHHVPYFLANFSRHCVLSGRTQRHSYQSKELRILINHNSFSRVGTEPTRLCQCDYCLIKSTLE